MKSNKKFILGMLMPAMMLSIFGNKRALYASTHVPTKKSNPITAIENHDVDTMVVEEVRVFLEDGVMKDYKQSHLVSVNRAREIWQLEEKNKTSIIAGDTIIYDMDKGKIVRNINLEQRMKKSR